MVGGRGGAGDPRDLRWGRAGIRARLPRLPVHRAGAVDPTAARLLPPRRGRNQHLARRPQRAVDRGGGAGDAADHAQREPLHRPDARHVRGDGGRVPGRRPRPLLCVLGGDAHPRLLPALAFRRGREAGAGRDQVRPLHPCRLAVDAGRRHRRVRVHRPADIRPGEAGHHRALGEHPVRALLRVRAGVRDQDSPLPPPLLAPDRLPRRADADAGDLRRRDGQGRRLRLSPDRRPAVSQPGGLVGLAMGDSGPRRGGDHLGGADGDRPARHEAARRLDRRPHWHPRPLRPRRSRATHASDGRRLHHRRPGRPRASRPEQLRRRVHDIARRLGAGPCAGRNRRGRPRAGARLPAPHVPGRHVRRTRRPQAFRGYPGRPAGTGGSADHPHVCHRTVPLRPDAADDLGRPGRLVQVTITAALPTYGWSQALADLGQISPIATLVGFMLLAIVADLVIPRKRRSGVVAMIAVTGLSYSLGTAVYRWLYAQSGPAYSGMATGDSFALFFDVLFASLGILTVAISHSYLQKRGMREGEFHILIVGSIIGMMVLASATSLGTVFLGLELLSIALYIASGFARDDNRSQEAAAKYLLVGGFASAFVLYGMALVYGAAGTTLIPDIAKQVSGSAANNPLLTLGIVLMGVGFAFKVSAAPFHMWTPDVYQGAPIPVTAFMSVGTKAAAFAMIVRVFAGGLPHLAPSG